ncbi:MULTISPECIES: flagellar brake protein [Ralstonia]|uniref:Flagellar brake protein n=1 Tax=Ralstonia insidiosa TaxID=190721 RepID=A0A848NV70_9RALS|nr:MULTISPECIES: flagellar brake protein [Ralstonia]ANH76586.1 pilZ domain protein [Ralstonia insidiosa]MBY4705548.1 flagellar brake protein [Ralstonia insidiosa]NMV36386.1 flagellar brake protein [Ralstonia insidiosa]
MLELQPLDIPLAIPLPWPMLDADGQLLVPKGDVIHSPEEIDLLFTLHRPHRQADGSPQPAPAFANTQFPNTLFPDMGGEDPDGERNIAMELLGLRPGGMLTVRLTAGAGQSKGAARVMGYSPQRHLLITMPTDSGRAVMPVKDELLEIHAFSGEGIASFECTVMAVCRIPFEYVVLSPPRRIKNRTLRKSLRVRTNVVGKMLVSGEPPRMIHISDISTTGASFRSAHRLEVSGAPARLRFRVKTRDYHSELVAATLIRSEKPADLPNTYQYGVEFIELVAAQKMLLQCFIYEQLLWGGQRMV